MTRIVLLAPLVAPLGARQVGGAQSLVSDLAGALAAAGEDVEVIAAPGSRVPGVRVRPAPGGPFPDALLRLGREPGPPEGETVSGPPPAPAAGGGSGTAAGRSRWPALQAPTYRALAGGLRGRDVLVHAHAMDWAAFAFTAGIGTPVVHTLHLGPVDPASAAAAAAAASTRPRPCFVAPSRAVADSWRSRLRVDEVVANGVDAGSVPFGDRPDPGLAVVAGRISPEKGTHLAIAAALAAGLRVVVAGAVYDRGYFDGEVAPLVDGRRVRHLGQLSRARLHRLLGGAAVCVCASLWAEPFGLVAVESALAGTPVAVTPAGALPEVVDDDLGAVAAGFSIPAVAEAVTEARRRDRAAVRAAAVRRHDLGGCVARYRAIYRRLGA